MGNITLRPFLLHKSSSIITFASFVILHQLEAVTAATVEAEVEVEGLKQECYINYSCIISYVLNVNAIFLNNSKKYDNPACYVATHSCAIDNTHCDTGTGHNWTVRLS